jgi:hypothetical protein
MNKFKIYKKHISYVYTHIHMNNLTQDCTTSHNIIKLTHPTICDFYARNPHISPETVNLNIIEMLDKTQNVHNSASPSTIVPTSQNMYRKQTVEMKELSDNLRDTVSELITKISQEYIFIKTEYVNEFRSVWSQSCCVSRREILLENNRKIVHSIEQLLYDVRNIKRIHSSIGEKIDVIVKQFHKIIHNNVETILTKPTDISTVIPEFIHNFEINSSHMINTIQQLLTDFTHSKDAQFKKIADMFSVNGESAISTYCKYVYEIKDFLQSISSPQVIQSTSQIVTLLSRLYNTGYIQPDETNPSLSILTRDDKPAICIQQLQIKDRNINTDEISRFIQITKNKNIHGILVSQYTGITSKPNLYIDIINNRVYVYVHSMEYSPEKLQTAIDIVDTISSKLTDFNNSTEQKYTVPKDVLDEINREYQAFIVQKETILTTMKESYKKILSQMEDLRFMSLDKYLSTRYSYFKKQGYMCNLCNVFSVSTLKGLAAHKRGCTRKMCVASSEKTSLSYDSKLSTGNTPPTFDATSVIIKPEKGTSYSDIHEFHTVNTVNI